MIKRIALVGASSTGKTTVFELLKGKLPKSNDAIFKISTSICSRSF